MLTLADIIAARSHVMKAAHHTPLIPSRTFSDMAGRQVCLKAENLQRTGSFKVRGAYNRIAQLTVEERARGVIAASAGNHAQGVALAAREAGIRATIVMPVAASIAKVEATKGYGANVVLFGDDFGQANDEAERRARAEGKVMVPAYDDLAVIAGQGTIGLEILDDLPEVDIVAVPVGGGGLIGGIALAVKECKPHVRVIGVQAEAATGALQSFRTGQRPIIRPGFTLADGIAVPQVGENNLPLLRHYVDDIVTVSEDEIAHAVVLTLERAKMLVEGAGVAALAAAITGKLPSGDKAAVVLSGGNMDLTLLAQVLNSGLTHAGRYVPLRVQLLDKPGRLSHLLDCLAKARVNILEVDHHRTLPHLPVGHVEVDLTVETSGPDHTREIVRSLEAAGYALERGAVEAEPGNIYTFVSREALDGTR